MRTTIIKPDGTIGYYITHKTKEQLITIVGLYDLKHKLDASTLPLGESKDSFVKRIVDYFLDEFLVKHEQVPAQRTQNKFLHTLFLREANALGL